VELLNFFLNNQFQLSQRIIKNINPQRKEDDESDEVAAIVKILKK
jgi:hypothetical protein